MSQCQITLRKAKWTSRGKFNLIVTFLFIGAYLGGYCITLHSLTGFFSLFFSWFFVHVFVCADIQLAISSKSTGAVLSYKLRYIVGFGLFEMAISTKLMTRRNSYGPAGTILNLV